VLAALYVGQAQSRIAQHFAIDAQRELVPIRTFVELEARTKRID